VSGLLAGRLREADLTIVVSNDDGRIFEYLPVARSVPRPVFERLFAVPHGLDLRDLASVSAGTRCAPGPRRRSARRCRARWPADAT